MRWRRPPQGFPPAVKVTAFRTSPAARARKREYARRQRAARDPVHFYTIALPDSAIEALYARLHIEVLDKRTLRAELATVLTEALKDK